MGTKSIDWRPGPTVCRCCLAEGCYKDISTEYFWMGKREVYSEMLTETFDINISYSTSGPNSNSRLICEPCISRLRDACEFKRQVHECEKTFMQYLDPGASSTMLDTQVTVEVMDSEVKLEQVKQEKAHSDDDDDDDFAGPNYPDDDEDDDDLDDQPLTKFATRIPKKESVDILDLLDNAKAAEKRKSTTKSKAPPPKKTKVNLKDIQIKPTASKAKSSSTQGKVLKITPAKPPIQVKPVAKVVKKKKERNREDEQLIISKQNAITILKYSTANPFQTKAGYLSCCVCNAHFDDPTTFRHHMSAKHKSFDVTKFVEDTRNRQIRVDVTEMHCKLCLVMFNSLETMASHLKNEHKFDINFEAGLNLVPVRLEADRFECVICFKRFTGISQLAKHTGGHFARYMCDVCGKRWESPNGIAAHRCSHESEGMVMCLRCENYFPTKEARREHYNTNKRCLPFGCNACSERFLSWEIREEHLNNVHGKPKKTFSCKECGKVFAKPTPLYFHFKSVHTEDFKCRYCSLKFPTIRRLQEHTSTHTGEKNFICAVCDKRFARHKSLRAHRAIHDDTKKHICTICKKLFLTQYKMKLHIKKDHPEINI